MFIMPNPATASERRSMRASASFWPRGFASVTCASKPILPMAATSSSASNFRSCRTATRLAEKLTRAASIPSISCKPRSILAMQPAQRMPGTVNLLSTRPGRSSVSIAVGAFTASTLRSTMSLHQGMRLSGARSNALNRVVRAIRDSLASLR